MVDSMGETRSCQANACERQSKHSKCSQPHGLIHSTPPLWNWAFVETMLSQLARAGDTVFGVVRWKNQGIGKGSRDSTITSPDQNKRYGPVEVVPARSGCKPRSTGRADSQPEPEPPPRALALARLSQTWTSFSHVVGRRS